MLVEVLYVDDCPGYLGAAETVRRVAGELGVAADVRLVRVADLEAAERLRFLGSPTVRVDGRDIEPGTDRRTDFVLACRLYVTPDGCSGEPPERWLREALSSR